MANTGFRLRLPPRATDASLTDDESTSRPILERKASHTPRLNPLTAKIAARSQSAARASRLAYNPRSWSETLHLLALYEKGPFVLVPCALLTLWSAVVGLLHSLVPETQSTLEAMPVYVPTVLGSTMGLLLAFRLNTAYSRWWEARLLWGNTILVPRLLLIVRARPQHTAARRSTPQHARTRGEEQIWSNRGEEQIWSSPFTACA
eukprot:1779100-Prymnesium_polylepis.1